MEYLAVALGGFLGAVARGGLDEIIGSGYLPYGTLTVNLAGSFLLLFLMTFFLERVAFGSTALRLGLTSGFLGAFTTFSTLTRELFALIGTDAGAFLLYTLLSLAGGIFSGILGRALALYIINLNLERNSTKGEKS